MGPAVATDEITEKLILAGMAISSVCSAFANFLIYMAQDKNTTSEITFWSMGSLASAEWDNIAVFLPLMLLICVIFWTQSRSLGATGAAKTTAASRGSQHSVR